MNGTILGHALSWHSLGYTPLPVRTDGSKAPAVNWSSWQHAQADAATVVDWFTNHDTEGLGIVCGGPASLEMFELEGRAVDEGLLEQLTQAMVDHDAGDLWARIEGGYLEHTPSGGLHFHWRVSDGPALPNRKLARRPATADEAAAGQRIQVLIETRGQNGFTVVAPSSGRTHPSGQSWAAIAGSPAGIPAITTAERDLIHAVASTLDQMPVRDPGRADGHVRAPHDSAVGLRPGDDYNERGDWDVLARNGWQIHHRGAAGSIYWTRPGKPLAEGPSATTGRAQDADRFYCFTTSTEFEPEQPYSRLGVLAVLEHGGDYGAAAKALAGAGYGTAPRPDPVRVEDLIDRTQPVVVEHSGPVTVPEGTIANVVHLPPPRVDGTSAITVDQPPATITDLTLARYGQTEDGVARALVDLSADVLRYCPQRGLWLTWNGARWEWDEREQHRELVKRLARQLPDNDVWRRFRARALSAAGVAGVVALARTDPGVTVHLDDLDAHPWELNTPGGTIDMRSGVLVAADRLALHSRATSVTPDYDSPAPAWDRFLADTFGGDADLVRFVQRLLGLTAIGQVLEQQLPFAFGPGANGKSTLMNVAMRILGRGRDGYAIALDAEALMVRKHSEHPAELAQLAGARMVVSSEIEDGQRFAEARVKQLTGGDAISARFMRGNPFTFTPTHTLWLVGNHKPGTTAGGPAFWRRIKLLPFDHVVPEDRRDPHLEDKLMAEAPQILAWIARGAADYADHGMGTPDAVTLATDAYRDDQDSVGKFVAEACMKTREGRVKVGELRSAYERFCRDSGDAPVSAKKFGEVLRDVHGVALIKGTGGVRMYAGVTLYADADEPERDDWRDR